MFGLVERTQKEKKVRWDWEPSVAGEIAKDVVEESKRQDEDDDSCVERKSSQLVPLVETESGEDGVEPNQVEAVPTISPSSSKA